MECCTDELVLGKVIDQLSGKVQKGAKAISLIKVSHNPP
jgi:hypothetical protein